jgi:hypothetical protein
MERPGVQFESPLGDIVAAWRAGCSGPVAIRRDDPDRRVDRAASFLPPGLTLRRPTGRRGGEDDGDDDAVSGGALTASAVCFCSAQQPSPADQPSRPAQQTRLPP